MLDSFFNHHKMKRRFGRQIHTVRNAVRILSPEEEKSNRDFSWHGRNINPFTSKTTHVRYFRAKIILIFLSIIGIFLLLLYHPFFRVTTVNISGNQRIKSDDLQKTVEGIIFYKKWYILPQNSFIFANVDEIRDIMKKRFPIESIVVQKTFPNTLNITVQEKVSSIIYGNGKQFAYVDHEGKVIEVIRNVMDYEWKETVKTVTSTDVGGEVVTSTIIVSRIHKPDVRQLQSQFGAYLVVFDEAEKNEIVNESVLSKINSANILEWTNLLKSRGDVPLNYFVLNSEIGDMTIKTKEGWEIRTQVEQDANEQFENLLLILRTKINNRSSLKYIDLRYEGRFYWQ